MPRRRHRLVAVISRQGKILSEGVGLSGGGIEDCRGLDAVDDLRLRYEATGNTAGTNDADAIDLL